MGILDRNELILGGDLNNGHQWKLESSDTELKVRKRLDTGWDTILTFDASKVSTTDIIHIDSITLDDNNVAHVVLGPVVENSEISLEQTKNNRDPISNR